MLEIGLGDYLGGTGYSRNMWKEFFPDCDIFVMDIHNEFEDEIGVVLKGDQSNLQDIERIGNLVGDLDFIIDDGSHHPEHQIKSFDYFFNENLKKGGLYIIEDIELEFRITTEYNNSPADLQEYYEDEYNMHYKYKICI